MKKFDLAWLVGILEGEGTFGSYLHRSTAKGKLYTYRIVHLAIGSTDKDIIKRVAGLLEVNLNGPYRNSGFKGGKPIYQCGIQGRKAAGWMRLLAPYMGARRRTQIRKALKMVPSGRRKAKC